MTNLDEKDTEILKERQAAFLANVNIKSGDSVEMPDHTFRRVAHVWTNEKNEPVSIQLADRTESDGSYYLGMGYMSFSGSLDTGIPFKGFYRTTKTRSKYAWFFHHDYPGAGRGVHVIVECPIWLYRPDFRNPPIWRSVDEDASISDADPDL